MPTIKQLGGIAIAVVVAIVVATAVGISAVEHSTTRVQANRFTPSNADFRLNDIRGIELPVR